MHCLVTGGGGFLGRYIVEQLVAQGDTVRNFSRQDYPALKKIGVETIQGDLRDRSATMAACQGVDMVFHSAAAAGIWGPWTSFYEINTLGTQHVIDGCRHHRVPRLIYTSSPSVTFDGRDQRNVDETASYPQRWLCHYPHSKALAEQRVLAANDRQLHTCALRPHLIWGPRDSHLVPRLIERARAEKLRIVGDGRNQVDMVYVENAAAAHLQVAAALQADSPVAGRAYFISQGQPVYLWQWINDILKLIDLDPVTRRISRTAATTVGGIAELVYKALRIRSEPPMTRFLAAQLATDHYFDLTAAKRDFGYQPTITIDEGMQRLAEWLRGGRRGEETAKTP